MKRAFVFIFLSFSYSSFAELVHVYVLKSHDMDPSSTITVQVPKAGDTDSIDEGVGIRQVTSIQTTEDGDANYITSKSNYSLLAKSIEPSVNLESPQWNYSPGFLVLASPGSTIKNGGASYEVTDQIVQFWYV